MKKIPRNARGPLALTVLAVMLSVRALVSYLADPRPTEILLLVSLIPPAAAVVGLIVLGYALAQHGGAVLRTHRYRIDPGGAPADAIDHEVAHADKGAQFGGRTVAGAVYPDGSGWVDVRMPAGAPIEHNVAVSMAGAVGEGRNFWTSPHARGDRDNAARRVAHLPHDERQQVYREAERLAYRRWFGSGQAAAVRRALEEKGHY